MHYKRRKPVPKCGVIIFRNRVYDSIRHAADETGYSEATIRRHVYKSNKREASARIIEAQRDLAQLAERHTLNV